MYEVLKRFLKYNDRWISDGDEQAKTNRVPSQILIVSLQSLFFLSFFNTVLLLLTRGVGIDLLTAALGWIAAVGLYLFYRRTGARDVVGDFFVVGALIQFFIAGMTDGISGNALLVIFPLMPVYAQLVGGRFGSLNTGVILGFEAILIAYAEWQGWVMVGAKEVERAEWAPPMFLGFVVAILVVMLFVLAEKMVCLRVRQLRDSREEWTRDVSFQLRGPIAGITGALELASLVPSDHEKYDTLLCVAERNAIVASAVIDGLLDVERVAFGAYEPEMMSASVDEMVKGVLNTVKADADEQCVSLNHTGDLSLQVSCDQKRIFQVLLALVWNAVGHSPKGAKVEIRTFVDGSMITFEVHDQGNGVPKHIQDLIFRRVKGQQSKYTSRGIRLDVAKVLVDKHGGTIAFQNQRKGCVFRFSLPSRQLRAVSSL